MAEFTSTIQQVAAGQNAILDTDVIKSRCVSHRTGSGLICVENSGCDCRPARYKIFVKANIAIPTGGTVGAISLGIALNGEIVQSSIATVTPAATGDEFSVATEEIINAGKCPVNIAVRNPNTQTIQISDLVVIVERIC